MTDDPTLFRSVAIPWVQARRHTHRAARHDIGRMHRHLIPFFGDVPVSAIDTALVRRYIAEQRGRIGGATVQRTLALLSCLLNDLIEDGVIEHNAVGRLSRRSRKLARSRHDPRRVPFLRTRDEIAAVYRALPVADHPCRPYRVMFAVGVLAGLRPGEILALRWRRDVDLARRRLHIGWQISEGELGPVKDDEGRVAPIVDALAPVLAAWRRVADAEGLCFAPDPRRGGRPGSPPRFRRLHTLHKHLRRALRAAGLPESLTWYQCTRHTFASHWVMEGGNLQKLSLTLGHSSVRVTERYAHLAPDLFGARELRALSIDLDGADR